MTDSYKVFHTSPPECAKDLHVVLVRPEKGGNIGASARAIMNMGVLGRFIIVGDSSLINSEAIKFAKHARDRLENAIFVDSLEQAQKLLPDNTVYLAGTRRVGSHNRPHPVTVRTAIHREMEKLKQQDPEGIAFVFGSESDGLSNEDISLCNIIVTINTSNDYSSINLSQSVLIFCYEASLAMAGCLGFASRITNTAMGRSREVSHGQRARLVSNMLALAEEAGFILPGDPQKMRPRLESIFSELPKFIPEARTLHGLLDQVRRSLVRGEPDMKSKYLRTPISRTGSQEKR